MPRFAEDIENAARPETIKAIVIGRFGGSEWATEVESKLILPHKQHVVLSWDEARPLLDYDYDTGFGGADCHAITAWTNDRVFWVTQYDGATTIDSAPRHPTPHNPEMPGGG